jgi:hypothetical protein
MNADMAMFFLAPATLLLGSGLLVAGALSLWTIEFFKTSFSATGALAAGLALIVLTEFIFVTSSSSGRFLSAQRALLSQCELDAEIALPQERNMKSDAMRAQIVACMSDWGYEWVTEDRSCSENPLATNTRCYLPTAWFHRAVTRLQMKLG